MDSMRELNVVDKYKTWSIDLIKEDVESKALPYAVCMVNIEYDFNFGTLVRNSNAFGAREVFYLQDRKRWDRRSAVGTNHYTKTHHLKTIDDLKSLKDRYENFVGIEQVAGAISMSDFTWKRNSLVIFGSENMGLSEEILDLCDSHVYIPMLGSVRSLNVGTCSGIVLQDCASQFG